MYSVGLRAIIERAWLQSHLCTVMQKEKTQKYCCQIREGISEQAKFTLFLLVTFAHSGTLDGIRPPPGMAHN